MVKENGSRWVLYEFLYQHWHEKELQSYLLLCVKYEMVPDNISYIQIIVVLIIIYINSFVIVSFLAMYATLPDFFFFLI